MKKYIIKGMLSVLVLGFIQTTFAQSFTITGGNSMNNSCISLESQALRYRQTDATTNGEVSTLQGFLIRKNLLSGEPTGFFGTLTVNAVNAYQRSLGVTPTGTVGPITKALVKKETCGTTFSVSPLKVISNLSVNEGTISVSIAAGAGLKNKNISYWGLTVSCDSSVTIPGTTGGNICGTEIKVPQRYLSSEQDTLLFSSKVVSVSTTPSNIIFDLSSYNERGNKIASEYNAGLSLGTLNTTSNVATLAESSLVTTNDNLASNDSSGQVLGAYASCVDLGQNLYRGMESSSIAKLQGFLIAKNFLTVKATGYFGELTVEAVKSYQSSVGIPATGMVYDVTRQGIKQETCN